MRRIAIAGMAPLALAAVVAAPTVAGTHASASAKDRRGDVRGALDLVRVAVSDGGKLRVSLTLAQEWTAADLRAKDGEAPGSICLRIWTTSDAGDAPPNYLACATAQADGEDLRGTVVHERRGRMPDKVATADVTRSTGRTIVIRFSKDAIRSPKRIRFGAESVPPGGCADPDGCADTAPNAPHSVLLRF